MRRVLLLFFLVLSIFGCGKYKAQIETYLESQDFHLGEPVVYTVTVKLPVAGEVEFHAPGEKLGDFKIVDQAYNVADTDKGKLHSQVYYLITDEPGSRMITGVVVKYRPNSYDYWQEEYIQAQTLEVKSILYDYGTPLDIRDVKGPHKRPFPWWIVFLIIFLLIVIGVIGWLIYRYKFMSVIEEEPAPPAHELAFEFLKELKEKNYIYNRKVKEFYSELSDILRCYLEGRFGLKSPEMTTDEFLAHIQNSEVISSEYRKTLKEFLTICDMAKFAKYGSSSKEMEDGLACVQRFIDQTKQEEDKR